MQTSRLRSKLAEYYVGEGAGDRVYLEIPKGAYAVSASYREAGARVREKRTGVWRTKVSGRRGWVIGVVGLVSVLGVAVVEMRRQPGDERLRWFWRPFLGAKAETLLVYANPKLVGSSTTGLRIYDPSKDRAEEVNPGYAGAGEVAGASETTRMFLSLGSAVRLKRSQLFSWDDARAYNLIFLGAPPHNVPLPQVQLGRKLKFKPYGEQPRMEAGCVRNLHPEAGEPELYCEEEEGANRVEYALVTMSAGVSQGRTILFVAGTTTFGTQAAMEFLCDGERVEALNRALGGRESGAVGRFEALLRCRVRGGAPVGAELVLVRR